MTILQSIFKIYGVGLLFLGGAIVINLLAHYAQLPNWYGFLSKPELTTLTVLWLFIGYPFLLGVLVFLLHLWLK